MTLYINSASELINVLKGVKASGQIASITGESDMVLRKFNTDGLPKEHIKNGFQPRNEFTVKFNFGADYEKKMSKILGEKYTAHDDNRVHFIDNLIMQYKSTGTICIIYMPNNYSHSRVILNGTTISDEDMAYAKRFMPIKKDSTNVVEYRTLSLMNIKKLTVNKITYIVNITEFDYELQEVA